MLLIPTLQEWRRTLRQQFLINSLRSLLIWLLLIDTIFQNLSKIIVNNAFHLLIALISTIHTCSLTILYAILLLDLLFLTCWQISHPFSTRLKLLNLRSLLWNRTIVEGIILTLKVQKSFIILAVSDDINLRQIPYVLLKRLTSIFNHRRPLALQDSVDIRCICNSLTRIRQF